MKKILLAAIFTTSELCYAQQKINIPIDSISSNAFYTEIIRVDSLTKDELYIKGREWMANTFKSANDVIQMDDKSAGLIIGKGLSYITMNDKAAGLINYTIALYFKDGRYKYEIKNIMHEIPGSVSSGGDIGHEYPACGKWGLFQKQWDAIRKSSDTKINSLITNLKKYMINPKSDW
ncbi:MAG: DUF4468 domain-containing protein [Bacteroidota bacterium]